MAIVKKIAPNAVVASDAIVDGTDCSSNNDRGDYYANNNNNNNNHNKASNISVDSTTDTARRTSGRRQGCSTMDRRHSQPSSIPQPANTAIQWASPTIDCQSSGSCTSQSSWKPAWASPVVNVGNAVIDAELLNALSSIAPAPRRNEASVIKAKPSLYPLSPNNDSGNMIEEENPSEGKVKFVNATVEILKNQIRREEAPKKKRTRTTPEQLRILQRAFSADPMPSSGNRLLLAKRLGMNARAVQVWFQNRRAKEKLEAKRAETPPGRQSGNTTLSGNPSGTSTLRAASVDSGRIRNQANGTFVGFGYTEGRNLTGYSKPPFFYAPFTDRNHLQSLSSLTSPPLPPPSAAQISLAAQQLDALDDGLEFFVASNNGYQHHHHSTINFDNGEDMDTINERLIGKLDCMTNGKTSPNVSPSHYFKFNSLPAAVCFGRPTNTTSLDPTQTVMLFSLPSSPTKADGSMPGCTPEEVLNAINELPNFDDVSSPLIDAPNIDHKSIFSSPRAGETFLGGHSSPDLEHCIPMTKSRSFSVPNIVGTSINPALETKITGGEAPEDVPLIFRTSELLMLREEELEQLHNLPGEEIATSPHFEAANSLPEKGLVITSNLSKRMSMDDALPSASLTMQFHEMADMLGISDWTKEVS